MATLCLDVPTGSAPVLFDWLAGEWGLLFSDPSDFEFDGSDREGWISDLRRQFHAHSVRPLVCGPIAKAVATAPAASSGWISELLEDGRQIHLHGKSGDRDDPIECAARQLGDDITKLTSRFVLIIDSALQARAVLRYGAQRSSISALDLLASVDALRRRLFAGRPIYSPNVTSATV